ncbi:MAG: hypothetical protein IKU17_10885 [Clostridia bacterium]|nr:hypothetical protein [Clostridia bacterium]
MKKSSLVVLCVLLFVILVTATGCKTSALYLETNSTVDADGSSPTERVSSIVDNAFMTDGVINGTNAKTIEDMLKSNRDYNWWEDHSLTQSDINKKWFVYCANNEYNTYDKSYDLFANKNLEIEIAKFATFNNDIDYILVCASFFDTEYINIDEVEQWILNYKPEDGYVSKNFGDAEFVLDTEEYDDAIKLELSIYASE